MDPEATLKEAETLINEGEPEEAMFALDAYVEWRGRGGFGTPEQDVKAVELQEKLRTIAFIE